jgi:hypothetical protein
MIDSKMLLHFVWGEVEAGIYGSSAVDQDVQGQAQRLFGSDLKVWLN